MKLSLLLVSGIVFVQSLIAQNLVPNASFESGATGPDSWGFTEAATWETFGRTGSRCVSIGGASGTLRYWSATPAVQQGEAYVFRVRSSSTNMLGGYCIGGFTTAARDLTRPGNPWLDYSFVTWIPSNGFPQLRLAVWDGNGKTYFDDVEVLPLNPVHKTVGAYRLGEGESLNQGRYTYSTSFAGYTGSYSRFIVGANTSFNSFRWFLSAGLYVTYKHTLPGQVFSNGQVVCTIQNYNNISSKTVRVEASTNGVTWLLAGEMQGTNSIPLTIPASLLPASQLFTRLSSTNATQFALTSYSFSADVPDTNTTGVGESHYFGRWLPAGDIQINEVDNTSTGKVVTLSIPNVGTSNRQFRVIAETSFGAESRKRETTTEILPGTTNQVSILLPTGAFGDNLALLSVCDELGTNLFQQSIRVSASILSDDSYGELLPSLTNAPVWWCESAYKVGRNRFLPMATNTHAKISAARNEYEPFQLILRPEVTLSNVTASIGNFVWATNSGVTISSTNVTICLVEYVNVTQNDSREVFSVFGEHPDPLSPLTAPFTAPSQTNSPLWFTVHVPKDAPAGDYQADVTITSSGGTFTVPVKLEVFNFALTDVTHTPTSYGAVLRYDWHGLYFATSQQQSNVWELYMQNMARHRISPYFPQTMAPVSWSYNSGNGSFTHYFDDFDVCMERYMEEYDFNTFKDVNYNRELPPIAGVNRFTANTNAINPAYRPLYLKLMQPIVQHYRERGWLDRAYSFWIDEPQESQDPLVRDGMNMVQEMAPDLARREEGLYEPNPLLYGCIEEWVPNWDAGMQIQNIAPRQALGEEVWLYVATVPKAPWPNNFIDHPAISPRIRSWYLESMGLLGESYYGINYYLGTANPWLDPMSSTGPDYTPIILWGNGDGTLVYPPVKAIPTNPVIAGPIDSIRWEMLREGLEDKEYFWWLNRALTSGAARLGTNHPVVLEGIAAKAEAMRMLPWPPAYPFETQKLMSARRRMALAIQALDDGAPFVAKHPLSKVVTNGATQTLRAEAGGWPIPSIQWQHAGTNLPGATAAKLLLSNISLSMAGDYRVILSNSIGTATSSIGKLTVLDVSLPPQIIAQPASLSRTNLGRAVFGVGASSLTPLTYQWLRDGVPIAGETNVTLLLTSLAGTNAGFYSVIVSNAAGIATSTAAALTVVPPQGAVGPSITIQPTNQSLLVGQNTQLAVAVTGTAPLSYQWYFNGTNLPAGGNSSTVNLTNVQLSQAGNYQVVIGNFVSAVTSAVATVTVQTMAPFITSPPTNLTVVQGLNALFTVVADGTAPLSYQWFFNETNLMAGANSSALSITNVQPAQTGSYLVRITNIVGAVTSAPAMLQLQGMPSYTNEPPGLAGYRQGADLILSLAPDNRTRTVLVSTNLLDWQSFYTATPSAALVLVPAATTNAPSRYFRLIVGP